MTELLPIVIFYLFAAVTIASGLMVVASKNSVYSVFFLILAFFSSAGLFVLIGAEYIAMTLVIVYVGAVAVLFLFVVMMLDINFSELRQGFLQYLPLGLTTAVIVFAELVLVYYWSLSQETVRAAASLPIDDTNFNTQAIGQVLYTYYIYPFQMAGIILLVAMIGAIVLTLRSRPGVRRQSVAKQMARTREEGLAIVKVESRKGIE